MNQVEFIQGLSAPFDQVQPWLRPSRPWIFSICDAQFPSLYDYSLISLPPLLRGLNAEDGIVCAHVSTDSVPWFQSYLFRCLRRRGCDEGEEEGNIR
ncbi:hypothetical protein DFH06DRAFT_1466167, partial [Mycena polygramma]